MIAVVLALVAAVALFVLAVGVTVVIRLRPIAGSQEVGALRDKIPYRTLIADGVVQCEGGRLLVGWQIEGKDYASMSYARQADAIAATANAIDEIAGTDVVQIDWNTFREAVAGYPESSVDPRDPTTAVMYAARVAHFEQPGRQFVNETFLTVCWTPPSFLLEALSSLVVDGTSESHVGWERAIAQLQEIVDRVGSSLPAAWTLRRLTRRHVQTETGPIVSDELVDLLHRCFSHENHPIALPDSALIEGVFSERLSEPLDLEGIVADQDVEARFQPRVGANYFDVVQLETFKKGGTYPNHLSVVTNFPMPLRTSVRAIVATSASVERKASKRFAMFNTNSDRREGKRRSIAAERKASSAEYVDSEGQRWWSWNVKAVVAGARPSSVHVASRRVKKVMQSAGFGARVERLGNPSALAATWPGNNTDDRSESLMDSRSLCDLSPTASVYRGPEEHPNPNPALQCNPPTMRVLGVGNTPVDVYDSERDVAHLGSIGPIGTGKSTDSNGLIYLDRATTPDVEHLIFDQGYSAEPLVRALSGVFIDADPQDPSTGTCPFTNIEDDEEREIWTGWVLQNLQMLPTFVLTAGVEEHMRRAMGLLAKSPRRSMSLLQRKVATFDDGLAGAMTPWTVNGVCGYLFDVESGPTDRERDESLQCYELSRLMRYRDDRMISPLATLAFNRLLRRQLRSTSRLRVHIDEPRDVFQHPLFVPILAGYYDKIARKNAGGVRIFTQHPQQFLESAIATSVLSGTKTWFFKPNKEAAGSMRALYKDKFQISDEACDLIASATPQRHIIVWQAGHLSLINPAWQPEELAWIGATGKKERAEITQLRLAHPKTWQGRWYQKRGQHDAAARWFEAALAMEVITDADVSAAA